MAKQMTVGKRIGVGFTLVIAIAVGLGGLGVWSILGAKSDSEKLTFEYVPEVKVAADLSGAANRVMYQMRGYAMTDDHTYYEAAKEELAAVDKHLAEARDLAARAVYLKALQGQVEKATTAVAEYEKLADETVVVNTRIEEDRKELDKAAIEYMENANVLLEHQNEMMQEEIKGNEDFAQKADSESSQTASASRATARNAGSIIARPCPEGDQTIEKLKRGNRRYVEGHLINPHSDQGRRTETVTGGQHPQATILACSDSRVPVGALFDQGIGDLFPVRVAGNVCAVDELGSVEYGVDHLETPLLIVLGHTNCGAVTAAATGAEVHGSIPALLENIQPSVDKVRSENPGLQGDALVNAGVVENVWYSIEQVLTKSRSVQERAKAGEVEVIGAVYDIGSGMIEWLGPHPQQSRLLAVAIEEPSHTTAQAKGSTSNNPTKKLERLEKIALVSSIIDLGNATRVACFKSQALRDPKIIEKANKNFDAMDARFASLRKITYLKEDIDRIGKIEEGATNYKAAMNDLLSNWLTLQDLGKEREEAGQQLITACKTTADAGMTNMDKIASEAAASHAMNSTIMIVGLAVGTLLSIVCAIWIARSITGPLTRIIASLNEGADQVNDAATQVSDASQQLASGACEQASSLEETSSALVEMAAMTKTTAENARRANDLGGKAKEAAQSGDKTMHKLNEAMTAINDSSGQISKIIKVIEEIAFQTNLLALNAAVEAARAGEHGKGFAVVADEVRNLAQRAAEAANETTALIETSVNRAEQGTEVASNVGQVLGSIVEDVTKVTELIDGITSASDEQAQGANQVSSAVSQMDKVTQQNAAGAEESASAAEELSAQANTVKSIVGQLAVLVQGTHDVKSTRSTASATRRKKKPQPVAAGSKAAGQACSSPSASTDDAFMQLDGGQGLEDF